MKRLLEDSHLCASLRDDLLRARAAGHDYPATAKLLQLRAAISARAAAPQGLLREPRLSALMKPAQQLAWKLAVLAAVGSGAVFLALPQPRPIVDSTHAAAPTSPPPSPTTMQPTAAAPPSDTATRAARLAVNAVQQTTPLLPSAAGARVAGTASTVATAQPAAPLPPFAAASADARAATVATTTSKASAPSAAVSPPSAAAPGSSSSRREIAQLVRIRRLLERDPSAAYRLTVRSEREFPDGLLSEERGALAIVALVKLGSKQLAERNAQRYIARYPHSPMRALIEAALQP